MTTPDIEKLAALARMRLTDAEKAALSKDLEKILSFVGEISKADVSIEKKEVGVPHNVMREDANPHEGGIYTDELLKAAPASKDGYVKVKNIF